MTNTNNTTHQNITLKLSFRIVGEEGQPALPRDIRVIKQVAFLDHVYPIEQFGLDVIGPMLLGNEELKGGQWWQWSSTATIGSSFENFKKAGETRLMTEDEEKEILKFVLDQKIYDVIHDLNVSQSIAEGYFRASM